VARAAGVSETTVPNGVFELEAGESPLAEGCVGRPGSGRKPVEEKDPAVVPALLRLVEPDERGDPMSPLRWTTKSLRNLAEELTRQGHPVSAPTVGRLLKEQGFSLQASAKTLEGKQHPDRDAQFRYINEQVKEHQAAGQPVISIDAKKKEQLGQLPNPGRQWRPGGDPVQVEDHSFYFIGPDVDVAIPFGIYDLAIDSGWVNVGTDHDTSVFAVESIRRWWRAHSRADYPDDDRLLITADCGGSNSYRYRLWKAELAAFAAQTELAVPVCHFPPGTSKWNKTEHRLFSRISMNWRGRPLTSHEVVVNSFASGQELRGWAEGGATTSRMELSQALSQPALTGMPRPDFQALIDRITVPYQPPSKNVGIANVAATGAQGARGGLFRQKITDADRILATVLAQRNLCDQRTLANLFGVSRGTIRNAIEDVRPLLEQDRHAVTPAERRFATAADILQFVAGEGEPPR
jgi:transposase